MRDRVTLPARTAYETVLELLQSIPQKWYPAQDLHPDALRRCVLSAVCLLFHQQGIVDMHARVARAWPGLQPGAWLLGQCMSNWWSV